MITQEVSPGIMLQLKESTRALHDETEDGAFNQDLVKGKLPLERYVESLAQLFLIHRTLEGHLRSCAAAHPAFGAVLRDYQFQEEYLRDDLTFFGRDVGKIEPLPATRSFIAGMDSLATHAPLALMGIHYVFEGSNNGSKFISKAVRRSYDLQDGNGTHYLDPYGDRQAEYWQAFKTSMNSVAFNPQETQAIVKGAQAAFAAVMQLHRELQNGAAACAASAATTKPAAASAGKCPFHHG